MLSGKRDKCSKGDLVCQGTCLFEKELEFQAEGLEGRAAGDRGRQREPNSSRGSWVALRVPSGTGADLAGGSGLGSGLGSRHAGRFWDREWADRKSRWKRLGIPRSQEIHGRVRAMGHSLRVNQ